MITRNGNVIAINSSNEVIHYSFGLNWMVYPNETIFSYRLGNSFHTYNHPDFKPVFNAPDQTKLSPEVKSICAFSPECLFDYSVTQNIAFANSTRQSVLRFTQSEEILNMPIDLCRPFLPIENGYINSSAGYYANSTIYFNCNIGFSLQGPTSSICINGVWTNSSPICSNNDNFPSLITIIAFAVSAISLLLCCGILSIICTKL